MEAFLFNLDPRRNLHLQWFLTIIAPGLVTSGFFFLLPLGYGLWAWVFLILTTVAMGYVQRPGRYDRMIMEAILVAYLKTLNLAQVSNLRATIYVPEGGSSEFLIPVTRYMPSKAEVGRRKLHQSIGLVGLAFRRKAAQIFCAPPDGDVRLYEEKLVVEFGFTVEEAKQVNRRGGTYIAVPILDTAGGCLGVVYCDWGEVIEPADGEELHRTATLTATMLEPMLLLMAGGDPRA